MKWWWWTSAQTSRSSFIISAFVVRLVRAFGACMANCNWLPFANQNTAQNRHKAKTRPQKPNAKRRPKRPAVCHSFRGPFSRAHYPTTPNCAKQQFSFSAHLTCDVSFLANKLADCLLIFSSRKQFFAPELCVCLAKPFGQPQAEKRARVSRQKACSTPAR